MLQAALQGGHGRPALGLRGLHPAAARGAALRRRRGHRTACSTRWRTSASTTTCSSFLRERDVVDEPTLDWLAVVPLQRRHLGLPGGRGVLPRLADPAGRGLLRRVRAAGDGDPVDPQPRLGDRRGGVPDVGGGRRARADRDGRTAHPRTVGGRRRRAPRTSAASTPPPIWRPGSATASRRSGTSAHAFTLLHDSERDAFQAQVDSLGRGTTLLVDTYDVAEAVRTAVEVAGPELGAVRIDSGDLLLVAHRVRQQLDELGATGHEDRGHLGPGRVRDRLAGRGAGGRVRRGHPAGDRQRAPDLLDGLQAGRPGGVRRSEGAAAAGGEEVAGRRRPRSAAASGRRGGWTRTGSPRPR